MEMAAPTATFSPAADASEVALFLRLLLALMVTLSELLMAAPATVSCSTLLWT